MAGDCNQIIKEEIKQLSVLQELILSERESIIAMDRERLLSFAKQKEAAARQLKGLHEQREKLLNTKTYNQIEHPETAELFERRNILLREVEAKNRVQQEILNRQMEQVENMLAFFKHFQQQSPVYDRKGKLR